MKIAVFKNILVILFIVCLAGYFIVKTWFRELITDDLADIFLWIGGISFIFLALMIVKTANLTTSTRTYINAIGLLIIVAVGTFGIWGFFSEAGQKRYTEMDAMLPFLAMVAAGILAFVLVILNVIWVLRSKL